MTINRIVVPLTLCGLGVAVLTGCVERKERLEISPNGSIHMLVDHRSNDVKDLYEGDAVPRANNGWLARQEVLKDAEGKETYRLIAENLFGPRVNPPVNFAQKTDPDADLYLQFPASLQVEQRTDGTYYHLTRTYPARAWAVIATLEERLVKKPLAELHDVEFELWTPEQKLMAVRAFATFETEKMIVFARAAFRRVTPDVPQDGWLLVQQHLRECLNHLDYEALIRLLEPRAVGEDEEQRGQAIHAQIQQYAEQTQDQLKQALFTQAGLNGTQFTSFMAEYDRQKKQWEITQDLGDDSFEITVVLPGLVTASNADQVQGDTAIWRFDGGVMRDREFELLVTSRLAK